MLYVSTLKFKKKCNKVKTWCKVSGTENALEKQTLGL